MAAPLPPNPFTHTQTHKEEIQETRAHHLGLLFIAIAIAVVVVLTHRCGSLARPFQW